MKEIIYYSESDFTEYSENGITAFVPIVRSKPELLDALAKGLDFPNYCGRNWDALIDMFRTLDWIDENKIYVIHKRISDLPEKDLSNYMFIVYVIATFWRLYPSEHQVYFMFDIAEKEKIEPIFWKEAENVEQEWRKSSDHGENDGAFLSEFADQRVD